MNSLNENADADDDADDNADDDALAFLLCGVAQSRGILDVR